MARAHLPITDAVARPATPAQARLAGLVAFSGALALPLVLWHRSIAAIASDFRLEVEYLVTGWTGYALIGLGLLFFVPVVVSIGRSPESRFYPRSRNAYVGWGREPVPAGRHPRQPGRRRSCRGAVPPIPACAPRSAAMGRFSDPQDPLFRALNSSIGFDLRLAPYDIDAVARARADARARRGSSARTTSSAIERGLEQVREEVEEGRFEVRADDEDVHMAIERRLTEIVGPVGGKLHTARSRNDQVATDMAMLRARPRRSAPAELLRDLMDALLRAGRAPPRLGRCPPTPTSSAPSPCYLSHHLLAHFWRLRRDRPRFDFAYDGRAASCRWAPARWRASTSRPTATSWPSSSASRGWRENSLDAVSNRDFVLDYLAAAATCATHLSQLGAELVLWSSEEFGFCEVGDAFASGSSLMPQKKNPDAAELLRAKAPRVVGRLVTPARRAARAAAHLQQGPPGGQGAALRRGRHARAVPAAWPPRCWPASTSTASAMAAAAADELLAATDVADLLVRRGVPFREAHGIVGGAGARGARAAASGCPSWPRRSSQRAGPAARRRVLRAARGRGPGSSRRSPRAAPRCARVREQLGRAPAGAGAEA